MGHTTEFINWRQSLLELIAEQERQGCVDESQLELLSAQFSSHKARLLLRVPPSCRALVQQLEEVVSGLLATGEVVHPFPVDVEGAPSRQATLDCLAALQKAWRGDIAIYQSKKPTDEKLLVTRFLAV